MYFVLIDDAAEHNDILASKLDLLCRRNGWNGQLALQTTDPQQVIAYAARCTEPTVYFLDIELANGQNTLSLFQSIQTGRHESYIIYVSAHPQYAMECLHTHAFDFLLKPWTDEQLSDCLSAVMQAHLQRSQDALLQVDMGSRLLMLRQADILCFSREKMYIRMLCTDGQSLIWRESFEHLLPRLEAGRFVMCHRSHIVNVQHIREVLWSEDRLILHNGCALPVSRRRAAELKAAMRSLEA